MDDLPFYFNRRHKAKFLELFLLWWIDKEARQSFELSFGIPIERGFELSFVTPPLKRRQSYVNPETMFLIVVVCIVNLQV